MFLLLRIKDSLIQKGETATSHHLEPSPGAWPDTGAGDPSLVRAFGPAPPAERKDFALLRLAKHPKGQEIPTERLSRARAAGGLQKHTWKQPGQPTARRAAAPEQGVLTAVISDHKPSCKLEKLSPKYMAAREGENIILNYFFHPQ